MRRRRKDPGRVGMKPAMPRQHRSKKEAQRKQDLVRLRQIEKQRKQKALAARRQREKEREVAARRQQEKEADAHRKREEEARRRRIEAKIAMIDAKDNEEGKNDDNEAKTNEKARHIPASKPAAAVVAWNVCALSRPNLFSLSFHIFLFV